MPSEPVAPAPSQLPAPVGREAQPIPVIPDAQSIPPSTVSSAPVRFLPAPLADLSVSARFQLVPTLTLSEEYSDNFNLTDRNKQSNFRSTVSPGLGLLINSPFTKGVIAYKFAPAHDSATDEFQYFHSVLGQVTWEAHPRWKLTAADTLTQSDQPEQADRLGLRRGRQKFTSNTLLLSSDYQIGTVATRQSYVMSSFSDNHGAETTSHTLSATATVPIYQTNSASVGYDYLSSTTSGGSNTLGGQFNNSGGSDASGHQLSVAVSRQVSALRSVGLRASYALRMLSDDAGDTDYRLWNVAAFTSYVLPGRLTLNSSAGVSGLTTGSGQTLGRNFFNTTSLGYQFGPAVASVSANRGFSETFSSGQNFGVVETTGYTGSLSYAFTPSLSGMASGTYQRNKSTGVGNVDSNRDDDSWAGSLAFALRLVKGVQLGLTYTYLRQNATGNSQVGIGNSSQGGTNNGYTENRVRASVDVVF